MEQVRMLKQICDDRRILVATAESVTVGHLQSIIAAVSGASTFFRGGVTAYNIDQKVEVLGVERAHAESVDCVSPQVAKQMAMGATRLFKADLGLATTGYAEPPDIANSLGAYAFYAIWDNRESLTDPVRSGKLLGSSADRVTNQRLFAELVLPELVSYLISREGYDRSFPDVLRIERLPNGQYRLGSQIVDDVSNVSGAIRITRKPIPIVSLRVNQPFEVVTTEGIMEGKPGDWLLQGVVGEVYVCPDHVFRLSYDHSL